MEKKPRLKAFFDENVNNLDYESLKEWTNNTIQRWRLDIKDKQRSFDNEIKKTFNKIKDGKTDVNTILEEIAKQWPTKYEIEDTSKMIDDIENYIFEEVEVNDVKKS